MDKHSILERWFSNNIFGTRKLDGSLYFVFYIFIPIVITGISLTINYEEKYQAAYCYVTILVSAFNSIYDATNRWTQTKSLKNLKLLIVMFSTAIIAGYCIFVIIYFFMNGNIVDRLNWIFLFYIIAIVVSVCDIVALYTSDIAFINGVN